MSLLGFNTRRPIRASFVVSALLLAGCVHSRVTGFDPSARTDPRTPPDQIRFYQVERPRCSFKEVGHVTMGSRFFAPWSRVVRKAREKAHEMGGDAIVSLRESTRISGAVLSKDGISTTETTSLSGTVVRFTEPTCRE
jgi:hypothetical protein